MKYLQYLLLAAIAVLAALFWARHPVPGDASYFAVNIFSAAVIITIYLGTGLKLQKLLKISRGPRLPMAFALSLGAFGTVVFVSGAFGLYKPVFAVVLLGAAAVFSFAEIREMLAGAAKASSEYTGKAGLAAAAYLCFVALAGAYLLMLCLTPPSYYDTLAYHLAVPSQYIACGRVVDMPWNIFSYYPQLMNMNCLLFMLVSGELSVKLLYAFTAAMSLAAAWELAGRLGADKKVSVLLLLAGPLFMLNASRVSAELPLMLMTVLLLYCLQAASEDGAGGNTAAAALLAGLSMSVKYTGALMYAFGALVFLWLLFRKKASAAQAAAYALLPVLLVLPYLARNAAFTGGPFYPFFTVAFNVPAALHADASAYVAHVAGFGVAHTAQNFLAAPFLTVFKEQLFGGDVMSPLVLVSILLLPAAGFRKAGLLALFMGFYYTAWFFSGQVLRFLLPLLPAAAVITGLAWMNAKTGFKYAALGLLLFVQLSASVYFGEKYLRPLALVTMKRAELLSQQVSYYRAADFINKNAAKDAKVLVLGDARTYFLQRRAVAYTVFNRRALLDGMSEPGAGVSAFKSAGITHVLVNWDELKRLKDAGYADVDALAASPVFKNIMDKNFKKIYSDEKSEVFEMTGRQ